MRRFHVLAVLTAMMISLQAPAVIKIPETAITEHDYRRGLLSYNRRTMVEPYQTIGRRDPKWDESAIAFLDAVALRFSSASTDYMYEFEDVPTLEHALELGKAAIDAGCDDPLVMYCYGAMLEDAGRWGQAERFVRESAKALFESEYPISRAAAASNRLYMRDWQKPEPARQHWENYRDALLATLVSWDFVELDRRALFRNFWNPLERYRPEHHKELVDAIAALEDADPWLSHTLMGHAHVKLAWAARGGGWAHTVGEEGWKGFREHLALAKKHLEAAWEIRKDYPEPAKEMIAVFMGSGEGNPRIWFDRAVTAQMDYRPAYRSYIWSIYPRWGGSHRQMYRFAQECLRTERYDTIVPFLYLEFAFDIARDGMPEIFDRRDFYKQARACLEGYEANNARLGYWELSHFAAMAWYAKDYEQVKAIAHDVGEHFNWRPFELLGVQADMAVCHAFVMTCEQADKVVEAETQAAMANFAEAAEVYQRVLPHLAEDDPARFFVLNRARELSWMAQFHAGDWVDIQPTADWSGWFVVGGKNVEIRDDAIVITIDSNHESKTLLCRTSQFGTRYEIAGTIEFDADLRAFAGPVFAQVPRGNAYTVQLRRDRQVAEVCRRNVAQRTERADVAAVTEFRVQVFDDHVVVYCNGDRVIENCELHESISFQARQIGIEAGSAARGTVMKITNLRIRAREDPPEGVQQRGPFHQPPPDSGLL